MRGHKEIVLVLLLGMASVQLSAAQGQESPGALTVDALVMRALAENSDLKAARAEVEAARGRLLQAGLRPNPMLEVSAQQNVTGPDNNLTVGITQPLDLNGRKAGRVGVAEQELAMKEAQATNRARELGAEVRMKAGEGLAAQRNLRITEELLAINREALQLAAARVRRGAIPRLEENLERVEVNRLDASRQILESQVEVLTLQLKVLVGLAPEAPLSLKGELTAPPMTRTREAALQEALSGRPDLVAARAEVAMARAKIRKEEAEGRWDASVNVGYMRQNFGYDLSGLNARGETRPITDIFHYVGGGVTIMLPVSNRNQGNVAAAFAETQAAERREALAVLSVRQEVQAAFVQYEAATRALEMYAHGVRDLAGQNLEVIRKAHQLGRSSLLEVIAEQRRYIDIEMGYTEALQHAYNAVVAMERAVGAVSR
jgi:cobalt-zinc-cadmium efflux system outer membrane protein